MPLTVAVLVPFTPGQPHRDTAWSWVSDQYQRTHPDWAVHVGWCEPATWSKSLAVADALSLSDADVLVVADADVWSDHLGHAVDAVTHGQPWAVPHRRVHRLDETGTRRLLAGEPPARLPLAERPYVGVPGGGIVVLTWELLHEVPIDPRFVGWGGEDRSWGWALRTIAGAPWRGLNPLWHLWHPAQDRPDRVHGSAANQALQRRYDQHRRDPEGMRALLAEVTA